MDLPGLENCIKIQQALGAARADIQISNLVLQL
jgi:hypothetical protein